ncbi:C-type lectin [Varanus komodoensis]|nr:C-type lectin [Varanus komodoensis]
MLPGGQRTGGSGEMLRPPLRRKPVSDPQAECQFHREGAQLASILTGAEERALTAHIRRVSTAGDVWIGLSATRTPKKLVWRWSDGSAYVSGTALWDNRVPSTTVSTLECISLTNVQNPANTSRWLQRMCATALPYVCKYKAGF